LEGIPRGLEISLSEIDAELARRQGGAGRGDRQRIEEDRVSISAGLRKGRTIGSPLCLVVVNKDEKINELPEPSRPRPGHADLAAAYRYQDRDIRGSLERASARETVARVAAGSVARQLLAAVGCQVFGYVRSLAGAELPGEVPGEIAEDQLVDLRKMRDASRLYTLDAAADDAMFAEVGAAGRDKDTVGGVVEVQAIGLLPGVGSHLQWHERLDARLAAALVSIPAFKGAEIGLGFRSGALRGSRVHDSIIPAKEGARLQRGSNRAGGLEGGTSNGENIVVRGVMKPISTLRRALPSVDLATGSADQAGYERSDICALSAASVIAEAMVALVLADALLHRVGGESMDEFLGRHRVLAQAAIGLGQGG
jgi:chorismate synthase